MENSIMVGTVSVRETVSILRRYGMKISEDLLRCGIEQKQFRFGSCIRTKANNRVYIIYKNLLMDWITERAISKFAWEFDI